MPVTVEELKGLIVQLDKLNEEKDALAELVKNKNKEIGTLEWRAAAYLEELGEQKFACSAGQIEIVAEERINLPDGDLEKTALFNHLRERGIADKYLTVHSGSLNALFFADRRAFIDQGGDPMLFSMPGIGEVKFANKPKFKPAKKAKVT